MLRKAFFILALSLLLAGCTGNSKPATQVTLLATEFAYSPNTIVVPVGQPITITIQNNGAKEHDFVIEKIKVTNVVEKEDEMNMQHDMGSMKYDLHMSTTAGNSNTITFTPTETGVYEFFCTVEGHKTAGMVGKLSVVAEE